MPPGTDCPPGCPCLQQLVKLVPRRLLCGFWVVGSHKGRYQAGHGICTAQAKVASVASCMSIQARKLQDAQRGWFNPPAASTGSVFRWRGAAPSQPYAGPLRHACFPCRRRAAPVWVSRGTSEGTSPRAELTTPAGGEEGTGPSDVAELRSRPVLASAYARGTFFGQRMQVAATATPQLAPFNQMPTI